MKNIITFFLASAFAISANANPITPESAKSLALQYLVPGHSMQMIKKAKRVRAIGTNSVAAKSAPYYIFSRGENQGYVIVSGDDCLPSILGYTETGNYDEENLPPMLQYMLESWQNTVELAQSSSMNTPLYANGMIPLAAGRQNIAPLTTSHWHQTGPYNDMCPNRDDNGSKSMTGCVATAISQILYYWRRDLPSTLQASTPTYPMDGYSHASVKVSIPKGTPLKWDLMLDSYNGAPKEYNEAVATMVYAVGTASHLEYSIEGGTATSGHIEDIPNAISNFFGMNGGWVAYRTSYAQDAWTQLIYDELVQGRPVMYTGVHPSNGGHAVYIDGYQTNNNLMHFNFGWGGQGDGYFTTTLETGMNGFNDYQSCLINAYPKKRNIKASISLPVHSYVNVENAYKVTVENNSTLDYSGVYCFISTSKSKPSNLSSAKSSDEYTVIKRDGKAVISLTAKPSSVKTWYVTITDKDLNILAQEPVEVENQETQLALDHIELIGSSVNEVIGGVSFNKIYNTKAMILAYVKNIGSCAFGGTAKINLYSSTDDGASYQLEGTFNKYDSYIPFNETGCVQFSVTGLTEGKLYYAEVESEWGATTSKAQVENTSDSHVYFTSAGATNLAATLNGDVLSFEGKWDASQFIALVTRSKNKVATSYDITKVEGVGTLPDTEYPSVNALVYASEGAKGTNVIVNNQASAIKLTAGNNFTPSGDITINGKALFDINQEPAEWYLTTVPFSVEVPNGIIAREVTGHTTTGISNKTVNLTSLEAGKTYLMMTSSKQRQTLTSSAEGNILKAEPVQNADAAFVGIYSATEAPSGSKITKDKDGKTYFMDAKGEVVEGLRGYFYDSKMTSSTNEFRAYSNIALDPSYIDLALRIQALYDAQAEMEGLVDSETELAMSDTIAKAEAVFSQQAITTSSEVKKYYGMLDEWITKFKSMAKVDGNAAIDMTNLITNPSFEASKTSATGWTSEGAVNVRQNSNLIYKTVYGDGELFLYSGTGAAVTQTLSLAPGIYTLTAKLGSDEDNSITLFADKQEVVVKAHSFGKHYLTEARLDSIVVDESGTLTIGVKADNWFNADDFHLAFTGVNHAVGITEHLAAPVREGIYTLQGIRVKEITAPGVYVINGKKIVKP